MLDHQTLFASIGMAGKRRRFQSQQIQQGTSEHMHIYSYYIGCRRGCQAADVGLNCRRW